MFKFHDDPTVNESEIIVFLRQVLWAAGKRKGFERRREKTKNDMTIYTYGTQNLLLLYLFIFNIL